MRYLQHNSDCFYIKQVVYSYIQSNCIVLISDPITWMTKLKKKKSYSTVYTKSDKNSQNQSTKYNSHQNYLKSEGNDR